MKSWRSTRAGRNEISSDGSASGCQRLQRLGVGLLAVPERVLEQDPEGVGEPFGALDPEDLVAAAAGAEGGRAHAVDCMERPAVPI